MKCMFLNIILVFVCSFPLRSQSHVLNYEQQAGFGFLANGDYSHTLKMELGAQVFYQKNSSLLKFSLSHAFEIAPIFGALFDEDPNEYLSTFSLTYGYRLFGNEETPFFITTGINYTYGLLRAPTYYSEGGGGCMVCFGHIVHDKISIREYGVELGGLLKFITPYNAHVDFFATYARHKNFYRVKAGISYNFIIN